MIEYKQYAGGGDFYEQQTQDIMEILPDIVVQVPEPKKDYGFEITMAIIVAIIAPIIVAKFTKGKSGNIK